MKPPRRVRYLCRASGSGGQTAENSPRGSDKSAAGPGSERGARAQQTAHSLSGTRGPSTGRSHSSPAGLAVTNTAEKDKRWHGRGQSGLSAFPGHMGKGAVAVGTGWRVLGKLAVGQHVSPLLSVCPQEVGAGTQTNSPAEPFTTAEAGRHPSVLGRRLDKPHAVRTTQPQGRVRCCCATCPPWSDCGSVTRRAGVGRWLPGARAAGRGLLTVRGCSRKREGWRRLHDSADAPRPPPNPHPAHPDSWPSWFVNSRSAQSQTPTVSAPGDPKGGREEVPGARPATDTLSSCPGPDGHQGA